ncbi:MAG TPA: ATP-binding domain-containing protein, partial [Armatimonadota bacterium]
LQATNELVTLEQLGKILQAAAIERIVDDQQLHWWERHLNAKWEKRLGYPIAVVRSGRTPKMVSLPRLIVGTIHSVKGGEADVVILLADMSRAGYEAWTRSGEGRDAVIRTFYVGMTRARETLLLVDSHHREHMVWPG